MIKIIDKKLCCGCGACQQRCPKQCITLKRDSEGFLYPNVNTDLCIECGLCEKVCHEINPYKERTPLSVLAANSTDDKIRFKSSSGGIFTLISEEIIKQGGVVFGARYDVNWQVVLDYTETIEGIDLFRGSKYVQASTLETYKKVEEFLKKDRLVMFSGTPCQIAGLHHFLMKEYTNLFTVDFVCHGVPSPKVWELYLKEVLKGKNAFINDIQFRNKDNGWKKFNFKIDYLDSGEKTTYSSWHQENHYMKAFLRNMILRPSCHNCKAKHGSSKSDITIADFWGIANSHPEMDDDKGTSLVLINSPKGNEYFPYLKTVYTESSLDIAKKNNPGLNHIATLHPNRTSFFKHLNEEKSVLKLIEIELPVPNWKHPLRSIKNKVELLRY